jgi:[ribosomal protein S5]-alanine N-acetyltransferase
MPPPGNGPPILRTERLLLRPTALSDLDAFHALFCNATMSKFTHRAPFGSLQESEEFLRKLLALEDMTWAITEDAGRPMLGFVGLCRFHHAHRRCEVAYELRSEHWGKGLVTEALVRVVAFAFETLGMHRLEGHTDAANLKSVRLLKRCGFRQEGLLLQHRLYDGAFHDTVIYARLANNIGAD